MLRPDVQTAIQRLLDESVASGAESGLQVAAYLDGRPVVDAWAGTIGGRPVDARTLFPVFSTGKGIAATAVNRLVERGALRWEDPLTRWWPSFAAHGKDGITLAHVLSHTAGMPNLPGSGTLADLCDWDGVCACLAGMPSVHPPGRGAHYHAITQSWLAGEPARLADGRDFARIVRDEVAAPLGIADEIYFGLDEAAELRAVDAESGASAGVAPESADPQPAPVPSWVMPLEDFINNRSIRRACIPASNGFMTARAVARHYAALIGEVDGVRLLAEETLGLATTAVGASRGINGDPMMSYGMGYMLWGQAGNPGAVFGHGGYGGAIGMADRPRRLAIGIGKARMGGMISGRIQQMLREAFEP